MYPDEAVAALGRDNRPGGPESVPTGSLGLDRVLGGGWPVGRVSEIYGEAFTGKTTLALEGVREMQKLGTVAYVPLDGDFNPDYARRIGILNQNLVILPDIPWFGGPGPVDFWVVDSLADQVQARDVERALAGKTVLVVSQVRQALNDSYRSTTGGFMTSASVRVRVGSARGLTWCVETRNTYGQPTGTRSCAFALGPNGIDHDEEVFGLAVREGLIDPENGRYHLWGDYLGHGHASALRAVQGRPGGIQALEDALRETWQ